MSRKSTPVVLVLTLVLLLSGCGSIRHALRGSQIDQEDAIGDPVTASTDAPTPLASPGRGPAGQAVAVRAEDDSTQDSGESGTRSLPSATAIDDRDAWPSLDAAIDVMRSGRSVEGSPVYLAPDAQSTRLGELAAYEKAVVTRALDGWYEIIYIGDRVGHGWVSQTAIGFDSDRLPKSASSGVQGAIARGEEEKTALSSGGGLPEVEATILASSLNVRSGPGTGYPSLGYLRQGDRVVVGDGQEGWLQIAAGNHRYDGAWVSASYVAIDGEPMPVLPQDSGPAGAGANAPLPGTLVFQTSSGGAIYIMNGDGSGLRLLAAGGLDPALSPEGGRVAYTRWDEPRGLYVAESDGQNQRRLIGDNLIKNPTWSPTGEHVAFSVQLGGTEVRTTTHPRFGSITASADPYWRLQVIDAAGGNRKGLADNMHSWNPGWGERGIVYAAEDGLYVTDLGGEAWLFYPSSNLLRSPSWSPDGHHVVATMQLHDHWEVVRLDADGSGLVRLSVSESGFSSVSPTWAPDSSRIAYLSDQRGRWELWVMDADGSGQHPLVPEVLAEIDFQYDFMAEHVVDWR